VKEDKNRAPLKFSLAESGFRLGDIHFNKDYKTLFVYIPFSYETDLTPDALVSEIFEIAKAEGREVLYVKHDDNSKLYLTKLK